MTTHDKDKIIAAAKEADPGFSPGALVPMSDSIIGFEAVERFYAIAFEAGAASRDAKVAELKAELETERCLSFRNQIAEFEAERDQLRKDVTLLRDASQSTVDNCSTTISVRIRGNDCSEAICKVCGGVLDNDSGPEHESWCPILTTIEALAATEPKSETPTTGETA